MSSCLSGGGRTTYGIDLDIVKSPSPSSIRTSNSSSSPSSTISESSNSPLAISTRKSRTPRKRPNQTYNEAAALLSIAYPNIFSAKDILKPCKFIKPHEYSSFTFEESSTELLLPFPVEKPTFQIDPTCCDKSCSSVGTDETGCQMNSSNNLCDGYEDFDTESILDEEIEEGGIDSIMGNSSVCQEEEGVPVSFCYGYPMSFSLGLGLGGSFDFGFGMVRGGGGGGGVTKAFRQNDEGDWWRFPTVNIGEISPRFNNTPSTSSIEKKKKKIEELYPKQSPSSTSIKQNLVPTKCSSTSSKEKLEPPTTHPISSKEISTPTTKSSDGMLLKLNYDEVLNAWSDKGSPFSQDICGPDLSGTDALAKLAQIDLFGESGALRDASVQRYKEKRRTRLFSKKIRYQVRKVNADQRPRMKGRFVRRSGSSGSEDR